MRQRGGEGQEAGVRSGRRRSHREKSVPRLLRLADRELHAMKTPRAERSSRAESAIHRSRRDDYRTRGLSVAIGAHAGNLSAAAY